jgi:hypothetical protein
MFQKTLRHAHSLRNGTCSDDKTAGGGAVKGPYLGFVTYLLRTQVSDLQILVLRVTLLEVASL